MEELSQYIPHLSGFLLLLVINYGAKLGRFFRLVRAALEASADGKLSDDEKVRLFDEGYAVLKGFFPNKSKVV